MSYESFIFGFMVILRKRFSSGLTQKNSRVRRNRRKSVIGTLNPSSTVAIIANVIENESIETKGPFTFDAEDLR